MIIFLGPGPVNSNAELSEEVVDVFLGFDLDCRDPCQA